MKDISKLNKCELERVIRAQVTTVDLLGLGNKIRYYYLKYGGNVSGRWTGGIATVCIIEITVFKHVRGIAFCTPRDQFYRKLGRCIALERALTAWNSKQDTEPIYTHSVCGGLREEPHYRFFSQYLTDPTPFEKKLFEPKKKE